MSDQRAVQKDWPMPRYGDPVWVTVSEYSIGPLRRVVENSGPIAAIHLLTWAMDEVIGRGCSADWDHAACTLMAEAITLLENRSTDSLELEPVIQDMETGEQYTLRKLIADNAILHTGELSISTEDLHRLCKMEQGDTAVIGGGAGATFNLQRII